jgi:hypothetical protein
MKDKHGNLLVFVVYDRSRAGTTTGYWQVASFREESNANKFVEESGKDSYFVSCQQARGRDLALTRD